MTAVVLEYFPPLFCRVLARFVLLFLSVFAGFSFLLLTKLPRFPGLFCRVLSGFAFLLFSTFPRLALPLFPILPGFVAALLVVSIGFLVQLFVVFVLAKARVVVIEPQQAPPPEPHIGVQVETGNVSVGGRIRTNR